MKATIERATLLKGLSHVQSVVERRNTIPILSNVLIEAGKGELKLTATDLDIEIVGDEELGRLGCVSAAADTLTERADPASLALFEEKWAGSVSGPSAHP